LRALLARRPRAGAAAPLLRNSDGSLQPSRGTFPNLLTTFAHLFRLKRLMPRDESVIRHAGRLLGRGFAQYSPIAGAAPVDYASGACLLVRRAAWEEVGGFDPGFFLFYEEIDFCLRLRRAGWETWFEPAAVAMHEIGHSTASAGVGPAVARQESMRRYFRKHGRAHQRALVPLLQLASCGLRLGVSLVRGDARARRAEAAILDRLRGRGRLPLGPERAGPGDARTPVLISACLLGLRCTYAGGAHPQPWTAAAAESARWVPVCPEYEGGLPVPRAPAEIVGGDGRDVLAGRAAVRDRQGRDVTAEFLEGAAVAARRALAEGCGVAVLKARSPSCGVREIHDGTFGGTLRPGCGVTAAALRELGVRVLDEDDAARCCAEAGGGASAWRDLLREAGEARPSDRAR
jgi:uncharacterized protein YbbK (DUF523 family)